jgi:hypothetical protein
MPNAIRIQPPTEQLTRGQPVRVPITLVLDKPLKVRGIHARFHGAEETKAVYTTTSTNGKGHTTTHTHTAVEHNDITNQAYLLFGNDKLGFVGNVTDAAATLFGGGKHETLRPGEYPFEVEVVIPADAPATHTGQKTRVFYELSVYVDVPLKIDLKAAQAFQVGPLEVPLQEYMPVRICYPEDAGRGYMDSMFGPNVKIEMALASNQYRLGESIDGIVIVEPAKPFNCNAMRVRLVGVESSQAQGHKDSHTHQTQPVELAQPGAIHTTFKQEFAFPAAASAPLTARGKRFSIDWYVQVEFDVPWAKDPMIRAPIVLLPALGSV